MNNKMEAITNMEVLISLDSFKIVNLIGAKIVYYLITSLTSTLLPSLKAIIKADL